MSHPSETEVNHMSHIAGELREVFAERGHRVDEAMEVDPAFGSGWARSAVTRDLVVNAVSEAASHIGMDFRPVNGSGREFRHLDNSTDRRYRLRRAQRTAAGDLIVTANSESALGSEVGSLFTQEHWTFLWTLGADGQMDEILLAEVTGYIEGSPGRLKLGQTIALSGPAPTSGGFVPVDEDLNDFGDEDDGDLGTVAS